jgi:hypothetical protein
VNPFLCWQHTLFIAYGLLSVFETAPDIHNGVIISVESINRLNLLVNCSLICFHFMFIIIMEYKRMLKTIHSIIK